MQYDIVAVDMFNLFYRRFEHALEKDPISVARNMVTYIKNEIKKHVCDGGKLFLLYDPIPKNDLGINKIFKYTSRQEIVHNYKQNRVHNKMTLTVVDLVRKYFSHRGPDIITVISNVFEADDFMESIIKEFPDKKIAMFSVDEDWCRYLNDNCELINKGFNTPFTLSAFYDKYNFIPNIVSVSVFKACFGDGSDNIPGALHIKGLKNANEIKKDAFSYVQFLGDHPKAVEEVQKLIKDAKFSQLHEIANKTPEEMFFYKIKCIDPKYEVESTIFDNLQVIKTRCDDYKKYASAKNEDEQFNVLIENTLGFNTTGKNKFKFGNIKLAK